MKEWKHKCDLKLLMCQPNPLRPDRVTVGYVLRDTNPDNARVEVRFAENLAAVRCLYPEADIDAIRDSFAELESVFRNVIDIEKQGRFWPEELPADFALISAGGLLTDSIEDELPRLKEQYLSRMRAARQEGAEPSVVSEAGRPYLRRRMQESFVEAGVADLVASDIPANPFTFEGDLLKIDFGYQAHSAYRMLHAVSVVAGLEQTAMFAMRWPAIRDGMAEVHKKRCEMAAIIESANLAQSEQSKAMQRWLMDSGMAVHHVSEMPRLAEEARNLLRP